MTDMDRRNCEVTRWGVGCGHPTADHVGSESSQQSCCCCTWRHNDPAHVDTCLDCSIVHGKRQVRLRYGIENPSTADVEPLIPEPLKRAFWERYVGKYFDEAEEKAP
jgi:hypothetical protein